MFTEPDNTEVVATADDAADLPNAPLLILDRVTGQPGFRSSTELAQRYATQSGLDTSYLPWYQTLALWKAAIFCEAIYTRWLQGERPHDTAFGPSLETGVPRLLERAGEYAAGLPWPGAGRCGWSRSRRGQPGPG